MRTRLVVIILLVVGLALATNILVGDRKLSPVQLEKVRMVCPECHGEVPEYDRAPRVHNRHASFDCSFCHHGQSGLKTTDNLHKNLKWVGIGTMLLVLTGIITNMFPTHRREKAN